MPRLRCRALPLAISLFVGATPGLARAQGGFLAQGVVDAELWKTDAASALLARNGGRTSALGRVDVWSALEPLRDVVLFGEMMVESGPARNESGTELYPKQFGVRYSPSDAFTIEGGRIQHVVGAFAARQLSFRNPLIGVPDGYATAYPYGVVVSGAVGRVDYRGGIVSLPLSHPDYVPVPSASPRPAFGMGITPFTGFHVGVSGTVGPYLNRDLAPTQLSGRGWSDYHQRVVATDAQLSFGYLETHAEAARGSYDVPGRAEAILGYSGYVEGKYTLAPRLYLATRAERNDYPFILPLGSGQWVAVRSAFSDVELGGGYRPSSATLLKLSVRADRWTRSTNVGAPQANGYALVMQLSQTFDLVEMTRRPN
ncbi:MAG: hypothetical protein JWN53_91 [Gemmatimonadetes bacterium]|nr:hypothetical protein [Gemmatimonadota bacterium]